MNPARKLERANTQQTKLFYLWLLLWNGIDANRDMFGNSDHCTKHTLFILLLFCGNYSIRSVATWQTLAPLRLISRCPRERQSITFTECNGAATCTVQARSHGGAFGGSAPQISFCSKNIIKTKTVPSEKCFCPSKPQNLATVLVQYNSSFAKCIGLSWRNVLINSF